MSEPKPVQTPAPGLPEDPPPAVVRLTLRFQSSPLPWNVRLRHGLKFLLRSCGLKLVKTEYDPEEKTCNPNDQTR